MILSQGRKIIQRQRIAAARQSGKIIGGSQQVTTISSSSAAPLSSLASSPSLPLTLVEKQPGNDNFPPFAHRYFSAASGEKGESEKSEAPEGESLKDTVRRMQQEKGKAGADNDQMNDFMRKASSFWSTASEEVSQTWGELLQSGERKSINKKIGHPEDTVEGDEEYTGPVAIMVIDESENMTAWERMQKRLTDAPVIQDILSRSEQVYEKSGAKKAKQKVDHLTEDAREAWETSQNPWVYRASSVYETLTAETPESIAVAELRRLDPDFTLDDWREDVVEHNLPKIMEWLLMGKINQLKPWLAEGVFQRIAAEITARKQEGVQIDTTVLGIMNSEILAVEPDEVEKGSPIIVLHFMCQQINCVRKKSDGSIVEGSEDDIKANSYVAAFQREYDEKKGELNWKIVDFRFNGAIAYL
jgi:import inner membrane translocase subunit TIM44